MPGLWILRGLPGAQESQQRVPGRRRIDCTRDSLQQFLSRFVRDTLARPEGIGYATFARDGASSGLELYAAPRHPFYASISLDGEILTFDANTLRALLPEVLVEQVTSDHWNANFYDMATLEYALHRLLCGLCGCEMGCRLRVDQWGS